MNKKLLGLVGVCLLATSIHADDSAKKAPTIRDDAPDRYTVVKGDTLWGISGKFLQDPWLWPEIWQANKQIYNPHLIFPGDVVILCQLKDRKVVAVDQGGGCSEVTNRIANNGPLPTAVEQSDGTIKLRPQIREKPLQLAIPTIPLQDIQAYLNGSRVVSKEELDRAPYMIAGIDKRLIAGAGDTIFVRNANRILSPETGYSVYRAGVRYLDPDTGESLGYEAEEIGTGVIDQIEGEAASYKVKSTTQEMRVGDKLLEQLGEQITPNFYPSNPESVKPGKIIRVFGSIGSAALNSVVVFSRGELDGVKLGHTFAIKQKRNDIMDMTKLERIKLPNEAIGLALVFRTFGRVSYALVLQASKPVKLGDEMVAPISAD